MSSTIWKNDAENHRAMQFPLRALRLGVSLLIICICLLLTQAGAQSPSSESNAAQASSSENPTADDTSIAAEPTKAETAEQRVQREADNFALLTLGVGIVTVLGLIIVLKINAFIALITAAIIVSLMAPGDWAGKIGRVASAFGGACGGIGIVIALAAVIGKCMLDSGAADRIVRAFVRLMGEKHSPAALMGSGYVLAIPVFFDTVFYLLVPLARSLHRRTGKQYLKYILAIGAGGAITHSLVPPTPGPLLMASNLGFDIGWMIMIGAMIALPAAVSGLVFAGIADRLMPTPMRAIGSEPEPEPLDDSELPSLWLSLLPVLLPVLMISANTVLLTLADGEHAALLTPAAVKDMSQLRTSVQAQLGAEDDNSGKRLVEVIESAKADDGQPEQAVALLKKSGSLTDAEQQTLIDALNRYVLGNKDFYDEDALLGVRLTPETKSLLGEDRLRMRNAVVERLNRLLLESAYPGAFAELTWETPMRKAANISALFGNANLALLISTVIAMWMLVRQRSLNRLELAKAVEISLMSGGVIILITAGGGAFGAMLKEANVGDAIKNLFAIKEGADAGLMFLVLGFVIASVLKIAQGSGTVSMITASAMLAGISQAETLGFHPVYLATAIGSGSLVGSWMNDSGFWIFAKMGGLTEMETLKSWTLMLIVIGITSFGFTLLFAHFMPLAG